MVNWVCNYCAFLNNGDYQYRCAQCNNTNRFNESIGHFNQHSSNNRSFSANIETSWNCKYCTFLNVSTSTFCEICNNSIEGFLSTSRSRKLPRITRIQSIDETVINDDFHKDIMKAKKIRNSIISKLENNRKFTDPEFVPSEKSIGLTKTEELEIIYSNTTVSSSVQHILSAPIKWLRPEDLRGDEYSNSTLPWAVTRNPSSDDIVQGKLGNCWLLTGLALIADRPSLLERILITKDIDPYGIYQVRLCKDGIWTIVTIDDLFPANQFDQMIYSRANRKQLWVSLIEKATAKLYGSYECLTLGYCADGLSTLTGSPCETLKLPNLMESLNEESSGSLENTSQEENSQDKVTEDTIWAMLLSANEANLFTCVSCGCRDDNQVFLSELRELGLRNLHAYAILDVKDIPAQNLRLLRLKNPWARLTWKGKWSDLHECWNTLPEYIRNDIQPPGVTGEFCGVFWISWKDVLTYFFALDICRYQSNWHETRMKTHLPWPIWIDWNTHELCTNIELAAPFAIPETNQLIRVPSPIIEIEENNTCAVLTVLETTQLQITLWQTTCRSNNVKPIDILIVICSDYKSPIGHIVASSNRQTSSYVTCDAVLDKGIYTIFYISLYYWQSTFKSNGVSNAPLFDIENLDLKSALFECSLSVHSSNSILLKRAVLTPEMIPQVISNLTVLKGRLQLFGETQVYTLMKDYSGMIIFVLNPIGNSDVKCTSDSNGSINLRNSRGKNLRKQMISYHLDPVRSSLF
uniref:Calcium-dependent cysteine protease n=1 Tax=Dugesia japonica TaxID=6161 RepID=A0A221C9L4_DUGJA|nr:calcium-dependent cysteine protease [Dugesia japonica]